MGVLLNLYYPTEGSTRRAPDLIIHDNESAQTSYSMFATKKKQIVFIMDNGVRIITLVHQGRIKKNRGICH